MSHIYLRALATSLFLVAPLLRSATVIDFEAQAANAGGFLTGIPDSPLNIGLATFVGGELRKGEIGLIADQSGIYASEGVFGADSNPITIQFAAPVAAVNLLLMNGENTQTYTFSDNLGGTVTMSLPSAGAGGSATVSLPDVGITSISVTSANQAGWNFAIDNVSFTETPEPSTVFLVLLPIGVAALLRLRSRVMIRES